MMGKEEAAQGPGGEQEGVPPRSSDHGEIGEPESKRIRRYTLAILFCLVCVGVSYFVTQRQQKLFRATSTIQILPPSVLGSADPLFTPAIVNDEVYLATQLAILTTPETIVRAVKEAGLDALPDFRGKSQDEIAKMAYGRIECTRRRGLYLVDVSVIGPEPKVLDELCNALVKSFQSMQRSESKKLREDRKAAIDAAIQSADSNIKMLMIDKSSRLQGADFSMSTFDAEFTKIETSRERFAKLDDELSAELMEMQPDVVALKRVRREPAKWAEAGAQLAFLASNARLKAADDKIARLRADRASLLRGSEGAADSRLPFVDDQIERAAGDRVRVFEEVADAYISEFEAKSKKHESLRRQIEQKTQELSAAAQVKQQVDEKDAEIRRNEVLKNAAIRERDVLEEHAVEERDAVKIESLAAEPRLPYAPNSSANLTIGLLIGAFPLAFMLLRGGIRAIRVEGRA